MNTNKKLKIVVGLGKTGISVLRYFRKIGISNVAAIDNRVQPPGLAAAKQLFPNLEVTTGTFASKLLQNAAEIILSPGVSIKEPAIAKCKARGIPIIGDIELFARVIKAPIIGITGSNGKSTVTTLLGKMAKQAGLQVAIGGNLDTPALDLLNDNSELYILELSSFQLETTNSLHTKAAVILNITEDHLDRYTNFSEYLHAKQKIYQNSANIIINREAPQTFQNLSLSKRCISFGLDAPQANEFGISDNCLCQGKQKLLPITQLKIKGSHQVANALAALALGSALKLPLAPMLTALKNYTGLEHRCQLIYEQNKVSWINDSKGTNVGATCAAINGLAQEFAGKLVLIAGGLGKNADFKPLQQPIKKYVKTVILIGKDAKKIAAAIKNACENIVFAKSMPDAVQLAKQAAQPNDAVLLSPACASFDMFDNFEHRGHVFVDAVYKVLK